MNKLKTGGLALAFFISVLTFAQKTNFYTDKNAEFKKRIELFQKEKFGAAQNCFKKTIETTFDKNSLIRIDAEYYFAICAIELFNKDGEISLKEFIQNHPESPKVKSANFYLGTYNYSKKKYKEAIDWFEKVDIYDLSLDELSEFYFKRGYSNFEVKKITEAKKDFNEIKEVDNKYAAAARYYCAHIAYTEKNYETALNDFIKLKTNLMTIDVQKIIPNPLKEFITHDSIWNTDFSFKSGEMYQIIAPSAKGKSTLVGLLAGTRGDFLGRLILEGQLSTEFSPMKWSQWRALTCSVVFQDLQLFQNLTALQNLTLTSEINQIYSKNQTPSTHIQSVETLTEWATFLGV